MRPFAPAPPPGAQPAPLWGSEDHLHELFGHRVDFGTLDRQLLEVTAFETPGAFAGHFTENYGPALAAVANARREEKEAELRRALEAFAEEWNRGTAEQARYEIEYLLAVGTPA
jgi:hypothetical protein